MSVRSLVAVGFVFLLGAFGWVALGSVSELRSYHKQSTLGAAVGGLWGQPITQRAPTLLVKVPGLSRLRSLMPSANTVHVDLKLEQRRKGLIWYPTYSANFTAEYAITNDSPVRQNVRFHFPLPSADATYEQFQTWLDGIALDSDLDAGRGVNEIIELAAGQTRNFKVSYRTRGLRSWTYQLSDQGRIKQLQMQLTTNFTDIDYTNGSLAPMRRETHQRGLRLSWRAADLLTRQVIAVVMPQKLNPGPLAAQMSYFAPVCLLFFFVLIATLGIVHKIRIHPMHFLFVTAGFFAFHLLFAYLVDLINVHLAFAITSAVSIALVVSYLRAALGPRFPWRLAALGQVFYLVLFSYSFFIQGMTGLTVTTGSIITLALLMRFTAATDWQQVFAQPASGEAET